MLGNTEKGYAITVSNFIITEWAPTKEECLEKLETEYYNITANMVAVMQVIDREIDKQKNNKKHDLKTE